MRDNYTRFYLKYVQPNKTEIELGTFRYASLEHLPQWDAILGFQFENLVLNNVMELLPHIGIGNATVESAAPYRTERKARNGELRCVCGGLPLSGDDGYGGSVGFRP